MSEPRRERADAVRNRRAILAATEDLLTRYRPDQVSVERIAAAAGVGKGTVFHRFGSRAGLMIELMQERATVLAKAVAEGPPPLGPGAPARERLTAFLDAVFDMVGRNKGLMAALGQAIAHPRAEPERGTGDVASHRARYAVYQGWHAHVRALILEERPDLDADMLADVLLSPVHNEVITHALGAGESERVAAAVRGLISALLDADPPAR